MDNPPAVGIVTVSDRASRGEYADTSGPAVLTVLTRLLLPGWTARPMLVPDVQAEIEAALRQLIDADGCCLVITTGGTGPAPRDVTPEATVAVCDRLLPGFGELMRAVSVREVPTAVLSRQVAGLRGRAMIINLPGSPSSIEVCLGAVLPAVPGGVTLAGGPPLSLGS